MSYGIQVGGTFDMPLKEMIRFTAELYYSHKGKKTFLNDTLLTNDAVYHFLEASVYF